MAKQNILKITEKLQLLGGSCWLQLLLSTRLLSCYSSFLISVWNKSLTTSRQMIQLPTAPRGAYFSVCDPDSTFIQKGTRQGEKNIGFKNMDTLLQAGLQPGLLIACWCAMNSKAIQQEGILVQERAWGNKRGWKAEIPAMDLLQTCSPVHNKFTSGCGHEVSC